MIEFPDSIQVVDSHTEGEATRVVLSGWPQPIGRSMQERREYMRMRQDHLRSALLLEPRGFPAMVGALLTPPVSADAKAGVVFFNNAGYLGMCGHGLIGVVRTLVFTGQLKDDSVIVDTPVGAVGARLLHDGSIEFENVTSYCSQTDVTVDVPGYGVVSGDIAFGGNWFFVTEAPLAELSAGNTEQLLHVTRAISSALRTAGISGDNGAIIDHIELSGPAQRNDADSRNFVLCPGGEFDRSPCGTGTSAKLMTLHARGSLKPGQEYRQESITGSLFIGSLRETSTGLIPMIRGKAFITGRAELHFSPDDPFCGGIEFA